MEGETPLSSIPQGSQKADVLVEIELDGMVKRKSGKRTLTITDSGSAPSIPDKEGSQTE